MQVLKSPKPPLRREDTGLRHHPEDHSSITSMNQKCGGVEFLFPPSSGIKLPESQQWSPDGAAQAGLIHVLLIQAGG